VRHVRTTLVALVVAIVVGTAATASATIVPQRGMAGVQLGASQANVRATLGKPLRIVRGRNEFGPYTEFRYPFALRILFQGNGGVSSIETRGRKERTAAGVGVGSTESEVRQRVANVRCSTLFGLRHCYVGSFRPGRRVTDFMLRNGRVTRIVVGFVLD
jgi:hypothetical protein